MIYLNYLLNKRKGLIMSLIETYMTKWSYFEHFVSLINHTIQFLITVL